MIWDLHCHLSGVEGRTPDERIAKLMRYANRLGVERLVFYMGFPWSQDPSPDELRRQNDQVLQALAHWHDRAFGFVYLSGKHVDASLAELDRCVRDGPMVGVKLWVAERAAARGLDAIIRRATELKAVVFQHTWLKAGGNLPGESTPQDLVKLARRHPGASLICGHSGGDWERGIRAIRGQKNVSLGSGGFDPTAGYTEMAVRELGAKRVIYGSDVGGRSFASQLAKITGAEISPQAKRLILGENLQRLLAPILRDKGIEIP
jgi:predicted TIM-barrel fold metal-dependent hydrolase